MGDYLNRVGTSCAFTTLTRRRQVDSANANSSHGLPQLAKELSIHHLIAIGVGSTIGAGVYILVGTVAREHSGPALFLSFLIAGLAAGLSAFCYAELSGRCPSAGSAYHYSYVFIGEGVAWLVGWALILEYTLGGSAVARGISPNLALFFGGEDSLPFFISRQHIPFLDVTVDPCAAILVAVVTCLLCFGIQSSTRIQSIITSLNVCVMLFVVIAGGYLGFKTGWVGYKLPTGLFPFGVDGMLAGSATVFFAYIGFDSVVSTAEEVMDPQRDLPRGITAALFICGGLYMLVSAVIVGIVPYYAMDPDTPISSAFASHDMKWAVYIITFGALTALCSTLLGSLLPQPRILMAMARDGLLPPFFSEVHSTSHVPVKSTITTGIFSAVLAFFMDVTQLAGMVSVGTLLAFTMVAISVLIVRYVPPEPLPPAYHMSIDSASDQISNNNLGESSSANAPTSLDAVPTNGFPLFRQAFTQVISTNEGRRKLSGWIIMLTCVGALILTSSVSAAWLPSILRYLLCGVGAILVMLGLFVLPHIGQNVARHTFGHTGGYMCPLVPYLPIFCILINVYLLVNLGGGTWFRVSLWLVIGGVIYAIYGRKHSLLNHAYVPVGEAEENYSNSRNNEASFAHYAC